VVELERDLRELGPALSFPPTPDLAPGVRQRLAAARPRRAFPLRRALVLGVAVLVVAAGAVLAVPQARTAVLEWLGLRGVTIERVETAPAATTDLQDAALQLGEPVTLGEARRRARYPVAIPEALGEPDAVYFHPRAPGGEVSFVYRDEEGRVEALVSQFRAGLDDDFIYKSANPETKVEPVSVDGARAWWLEGAPHEVLYVDESGEPIFEETRLAANTLLWERGEATLRLEGDFTKEEALRIAESVR